MTKPLAEQIAKLDWATIRAGLADRGHAVTGPIMTPEECCRLAALYPDDSMFRSHVHMARHGFGSGEYKYFAAPLPETIATLRESLYAALAETANCWQELLGGKPYPAALKDYLKACHSAGQRRPTPLLLKYNPGDYNCLHQDLYGELAFPIQATLLLSDPAQDFTGGEFLLTEQRPRMQSRGEVVTLRQGEAVLFAVNQRPVPSKGGGKRGVYRVTMRHGVSRLKSGRRFALGIIFHDAR